MTEREQAVRRGRGLKLRIKQEKKITEFIDDQGNKHDSPTERDFANQLIKSGIRFECQVKAIPNRRFRFDFKIDNLLIEIQGGVHGDVKKIGNKYYIAMSDHNSNKGMKRDREKQRLAVLEGYQVVYFASDDVRDRTAIRYIKRWLECQK